MRQSIFLLLCCFTLSCCNTKNAVLYKNAVAALQSGCPENGTCGITVNPGKTIEVEEDEFGNLHYTLHDDASKSVFVITYNRHVPKDVQDGTYREEIVFECDNAGKSAVLKDEALQNVKLLFGRFCYCKGQTGYYKIRTGTLSVSGDGRERTFSLDFTATQTPQVLSSLRFVVKP